MPNYQKKMIDNFFSIVISDFKKYCERHDFAPQNDTFLTYLFDSNLLNENTIRRYTILETYHQMNRLPDFQKTKAVRLLAERFQLSDRAVWNMLAEKVKR